MVVYTQTENFIMPMGKRKIQSSNNKQQSKQKKQPLPVSQLFNKILPDDFRSKAALIGQYQHFFHMQKSDAVFQLVQVMNVSDDKLILSVPSPALVNYLRLHKVQLQSEIYQQFGQTMDIKVMSSPQGSDKGESQHKLKPAIYVSEEVSGKVKKTANCLDDEELKQSLLSLAEKIKK